MNKDAYYFPHFANARYDRKLRRVRKELGIEGYAIYFMILEVLREQDEFAYPLQDVDLLADDFGTSEAKVEAVVTAYDLFTVRDDKFFYSSKFVEYLSPYLEAKERNRINGIKGNLIKYGYASKEEISKMTPKEILRLNEDKPDLIGGESGGESQGDRNKSKVKKSKVKKIKKELYPFEDFWNNYDNKKERSKSEVKWKSIPDKDKELIKEFVPIYKKYLERNDWQKQKYPYTFLNSEIWNDPWDEYKEKESKQGFNKFLI